MDDRQRAFRFDGEEFVILLPDTNYDDAVAIANTSVHVTVSVGFSILKSTDREADLFQRADKALYQAKTSGRNRVVFL